MPNWKYPCLSCNKPVKRNQKGLQCNTCNNWVHTKCTDLTEAQYNFLEVNEDIPFYCLKCKPRFIYADVIFDNTNLSATNNDSINSYSSDVEYSSAHDSDFEFVDDSDSESRGLNFNSLPVKSVNSNNHSKRKLSNSTKTITLQTRNYKYPCVICLGPCREN